ncbi:HAD-IA family hydrolase [Rhizobium jaguaris]|uniref:HAD family hydrolase n=1 Tax=Rhizobium jaguaris TaxID=1312183 RepID=A0A387FM04_9HYPH|nr:HAD-IA family hydrolase [Rhizobium jaguaris]AYG60470.1 HAD family hydrolase [Rhizobium jaguaris]
MHEILENVLIWDFEGTLAVRPGRFAGALADAARIIDGTFSASTADLRPLLSPAFPWHSKELMHKYAGDADSWWTNIEKYSTDALQQFGLSSSVSREAARLARSVYLDISGWRRIDGTVETLEILSERGWVHVIMSNFAPELELIVDGLGLSDPIAMAFSSAIVGFEKPHEGFFRYVFERLGRARAVWMIGDNVDADIKGARAAGLKTILLGEHSPEADHSIPAIFQVADIVGSPPGIRKDD